MGNNTSCATAIITEGVVKVVSSTDGSIEVYRRPVKAVELMLENPRQFVCAYGDLKVGHRIPGLAADEELERHRHQLYLLLPIEMLYSVLSEDEMESLTCKVAKAMKHGGSSNIGRIFPVCIFPPEAKMADGGSGNDQKPVERYSKQRSWKPALHTIVETS